MRFNKRGLEKELWMMKQRTYTVCGILLPFFDRFLIRHYMVDQNPFNVHLCVIFNPIEIAEKYVENIVWLFNEPDYCPACSSNDLFSRWDQTAHDYVHCSDLKQRKEGGSCMIEW